LKHENSRNKQDKEEEEKFELISYYFGFGEKRSFKKGSCLRKIKKRSISFRFLLYLITLLVSKLLPIQPGIFQLFNWHSFSSLIWKAIGCILSLHLLIQKDGGIGPCDVLATGASCTSGATFHPGISRG